LRPAHSNRTRTQSTVPLVHSTHRPTFWLRGGHVQSIVPAVVLRGPAVQYRRERWDTPDAPQPDFIDVDFALPEPAAADAPLLVLFHGLEGNSRSHYARAVMRRFADAGWRALVVHFRGCSGEPNRLPRSYHSGDSAEANWVLRRLAARWPAARLHAAGVSLGGNVLAKWLGEHGNEARFVTAAAAVVAPLDLRACGVALMQGFTRIYGRNFLATLIPKTLAKLERFPHLGDAGVLRHVTDLYAYDNAYTAPVHGFRNTDDYWARASSKPLLPGVRVPLLLLNARNDPFVPAASLPTAAQVSAHVTLEQPAAGGHAGFVEGALARQRYLPQRLLEFFTRGM
jgi:uncharacterized protein